MTAQGNLPTIASNHFDMVMAHYEHCAGLIRRVGTTQHAEHAGEVRARVLPTVSDFIADTELACLQALAGHPRLLALWRGVFVEERFSENKVRTKLPQEWLAITELCGAALWKKIPNVHDYFRLTSDQQAARNQARRETLKLSRKAEKLTKEARNQRRRERYAERKKEPTGSWHRKERSGMKKGIKRNVLQRVNANRQRAQDAIEREEREREMLRKLAQQKPEKPA